MIKLAVSGCQGRMGQSITRLALEDNAFALTTVLEHKDHPKADGKVGDLAISTDNAALGGSDVLIEFTLPDGTMANLEAAAKYGVKMVIGTTGLSTEQVEKIIRIARELGIETANPDEARQILGLKGLSEVNF